MRLSHTFSSLFGEDCYEANGRFLKHVLDLSLRDDSGIVWPAGSGVPSDGDGGICGGSALNHSVYLYCAANLYTPVVVWNLSFP